MRRLLMVLLFGLCLLADARPAVAVDGLLCWFPPAWKDRPEQATAIAGMLGKGSGLAVEARIASTYAEILDAFVGKGQHLVYAGSFVQAVIVARDLGTPLAQVVDGKEMYSCVLILPRGVDPQAVLEKYPTRIAFTAGASSGESCAKAATGGRAELGVASHGAALASLLAGEAKGAMVKNTWWESIQALHPGLVAHTLPELSIALNPDNILSVSSAVPEAWRQRIIQAAREGVAVFAPGSSLRSFDAGQLNFSLGLMRKGKIDPLTYRW